MAASLTSLTSPGAPPPEDGRSTVAVVRAATTIPSGDSFRGLTDELETAPTLGNAIEMVRARIRASLGPEYDTFVAERNTLVHRHLDGVLSPREASRLSFLRWQLDRIEDAIEGDGLDRLESLVNQQELLAERIEEFENRLRTASPSVFTPRQSRRR